MAKAGYVYMLASSRYGTLYIGVTSNLIQRVWQHRAGLADGFTKTHRVKRLVWFEAHEGILAAITREKLLKQWNRTWKINLIHKTNPLWYDPFDEICG